MRVRFEGSRAVAVGRTIAGEPLPGGLEDVPIRRLARVDGAVVDAATLDRFWVDETGRKHGAPDNPTWQALDCAWDDVLVRDADGPWRIRTDQDRWLRETLDEDQWQYLLDRTGLRETLEATLAALPRGTQANRDFAAGLRQVAAGRGGVELGTTLELVAFMRDRGLPEGITAPTDEEITEAWTAAARFEGARSLGFGGAS